MARLQILELPVEHHDDDMVTPFLLVIDQVAADESERIIASQDAFDGVSRKSGARAIVVFHGVTIDIPANAPPPASDNPEHAGVTQIVYAHERTRLDLCSALLLDSGTSWRRLVELAAERQRELAGLLRERDTLAEVLRVDSAADWSVFSDAITRLAKEHDGFRWRLGRVRQTPTSPGLMDSQQKHPEVWKHGYECGVRSVQAAAWPGDEETRKP